MSTDDFLMEAKAKELAAQNDYYKPMAEMKYRGNMNTTTIRTAKGKTIMIQHDVSTPHPYDRLHVLTGTKGSCRKYEMVRKISVRLRKTVRGCACRGYGRNPQPASDIAERRAAGFGRGDRL